MKYSSKVRHESKACLGVAFTIRKLTEGRRIELAEQLAEPLEAIYQLRRAMDPDLMERVRQRSTEMQGAVAANDTPAIERLSGDADVAEAVRLQSQIQAIEDNKIMPVYVRVLLLSVDGLEIDDAPATPATIKDGPRELYAEISAAVKRELGLIGEEEKNSESPTTSTAPADGETKIISAEPASVAATT